MKKPQAQNPSETITVVMVAHVFLAMSDIDFEFLISEPCESHLIERLQLRQAFTPNSEQVVMSPKQERTWPIVVHQHFDKVLRYLVAIYTVVFLLCLVYFL
jgi:hypothetical protein